MTSAEAKRLEALYVLEILDTPREERFDRITRTAVRLFRMPKSLLAFVDETRAWVKSEVGTSIDWVPRESSFSQLAIESGAEDLGLGMSAPVTAASGWLRCCLLAFELHRGRCHGQASCADRARERGGRDRCAGRDRWRRADCIVRVE